MGNRAVITTRENFDNNGVGVYLHWNGGLESVEAFLEYCRLREFRSPEDDCYGFARLCQVIGNFFGGGLSLGVDRCDYLDCDNCDNGTYIIDGWDIVGREGRYYHESERLDEDELFAALVTIDEAQPEGERLGSAIIAERMKGGGGNA